MANSADSPSALTVLESMLEERFFLTQYQVIIIGSSSLQYQGVLRSGTIHPCSGKVVIGIPVKSLAILQPDIRLFLKINGEHE